MQKTILKNLDTHSVARILNPSSKSVIMLRMMINVTLLSKRYTFNWNTELFKINQVLKTQPPIYRIEYVDGKKIENIYYEQELLKSDFDFESNNKVFETLGLNLTVKKKITRNRFN